jgi:signal peptidase II
VKKPLIVIFIILLIDQIVKFWIKLNFTLGEELFLIGDWCRLHFIENEGMAFGMSFGEEVGKLILTLFRIVAATLIFFYLRKLVIKKENKLVIYAFTLIFAGAVGNIIDSLFYGLIFSESTFFTTAQLFPESGGYAPLCLGKVVDMFYFPLIDTTLPQWIPFVGGNHFEFFNAIFNVADIAITVGVGLLVASVSVLNNKKKTISFEEIEQDTNK